MVAAVSLSILTEMPSKMPSKPDALLLSRDMMISRISSSEQVVSFQDNGLLLQRLYILSCEGREFGVKVLSKNFIEQRCLFSWRRDFSTITTSEGRNRCAFAVLTLHDFSEVLMHLSMLCPTTPTGHVGICMGI